MNTKVKKLNWLDYQTEKFEENRFALMTILLTFQSCIGSIAAMFTMQTDNTLLLIITAMITMFTNAMFIAQANAKICLYAFYISIVVNSIIAILNF